MDAQDTQPTSIILLTSFSLQAHPELTSKVLSPSPALLGFVAASSGCFETVVKTMTHKQDGANGTGDASLF